MGARRRAVSTPTSPARRSHTAGTRRYGIHQHRGWGKGGARPPRGLVTRARAADRPAARPQPAVDLPSRSPCTPSPEVGRAVRGRSAGSKSLSPGLRDSWAAGARNREMRAFGAPAQPRPVPPSFQTNSGFPRGTRLPQGGGRAAHTRPGRRGRPRPGAPARARCLALPART